MNLSFSTMGWQGLTWEDALSMASLVEFSGIEPYDLCHSAALFGKNGPLQRHNAAATLRQLREKQLVLPCLDSSYALDCPGQCDDIHTLLQAAYDLHIPYICVRVTSDIQKATAALEQLLPEAVSKKVTILLSTKKIFADTEKLRALLDRFADDRLGAMWDVRETYCQSHETAADTIRNLGAYIHHVHFSDAYEDGSYALIGEGVLPVETFMQALDSIDYDGFISVEWKPGRLAELDDPEIIFPHFVNYMRRFDSPRGRKETLWDNYDHTGKYIWKKDDLISLNFSQVLDRLAEEFPDQYAFRYTTLDYTRTYAEFREDVDDFAAALLSLGVTRGSKVAVWATNIPAWFIAFWATTKLGAVLVSVNTAYKIHEAEYLFRQSDTHTLIMIDHCLDSDYAGIMRELCPELAHSEAGEPLHCRRLPFLRNVITVGFKMKGCLTFEEAISRGHTVPREEVRRCAARVKSGDVCNMQYTSGTTGFPKGVMLTHYNVINDGKCIGDRMDLSTADRMMIQVPMFHCFGMVLSMTAAMVHGATLCPMPYFSAKVSLACINQEKITCFNGVPTMFIAMFNHPDYKNTDFSHMRTGIMAGAGCPPDLMRRAARPEEMNMTGIVSVYGQTESAPGSTMSAWDDPLDLRCDTVGYAFPHIQCKIIDPETGKELPDGADGEFCSRGYNTMKGYYKMPQATADTVDREGWLHSGDLARRDENGCYRITGRLKDMIIRGGENIYPKEIEEFIYTHPAVEDVQVIAVPDKKYGEEVMACVICKKDATLDKDTLLAFIKASLARHKVPKYIRFMDKFPMNAAGKVLKYKLREEGAQLIEKNLI